MTHLLLLVLPVLAFLVQLVFIHLGRRYRRLPHDSASNAAVAPVVGTVLSLMGLVLAFSFSNAATRLDANRKTILDEANAIETAWLQVDVAKPQYQALLSDLLRRYVDARIRAYETYEERIGHEDYDREVLLSADLFRELWATAVTGTEPSSVERSMFLNGLSTMRDKATARTLAMNTHLPPAIYVFLFGIVIIGEVLVGAALAQARQPLLFYRVIISAVLAWTLYAIMDMEYPRLGAFQLLRTADALLLELRKSMY
jgi:hypothetical protein